jgi:hypothetical protein
MTQSEGRRLSEHWYDEEVMRDAASRQRGGRVAMQGGTVDIPTGIRVCLVACLTYHIIQRHTLPRLR